MILLPQPNSAITSSTISASRSVGYDLCFSTHVGSLLGPLLWRRNVVSTVDAFYSDEPTASVGLADYCFLASSLTAIALYWCCYSSLPVSAALSSDIVCIEKIFQDGRRSKVKQKRRLSFGAHFLERTPKQTSNGGRWLLSFQDHHLYYYANILRSKQWLLVWLRKVRWLLGLHGYAEHGAYFFFLLVVGRTRPYFWRRSLIQVEFRTSPIILSYLYSNVVPRNIAAVYVL